jgi:type III secretion protein J
VKSLTVPAIAVVLALGGVGAYLLTRRTKKKARPKLRAVETERPAA